MKCNKKLFEKGPFPNLVPPTEVDYFSAFGEENDVKRDKSSLKFYNAPLMENISFNLCNGFDKSEAEKYYLEYGSYENILKWILLLMSDLEKIQGVKNSKELLFKADFVGQRGIFTKIAATPYYHQSSWMVCVTRIDDVIFMCEFDTEHKKEVTKSTILRATAVKIHPVRLVRHLPKWIKFSPAAKLKEHKL